MYWGEKGWNRCDCCGKFTSPQQIRVSIYFVPDSELTYEDVGIRCTTCTLKYGIIPESQGCVHCSWKVTKKIV
jgi:hypothetical protein